MANRWTSLWYLTGRKAFSRSKRGWWSGLIEAGVGSLLIVLGVALLVAIVTVNVLSAPPTDLYSKLLAWALQPLLSISMIGLGTFLLVKALWQVGASTERRGALVSRAHNLEFLSEIRKRRGDLPTVPSKSNSPQKGNQLPYRLLPSRQAFWGLITAGVLCLAFVVIVAVLVVTAYVKLKMGRTDWIAGILAVPISFAAIWSFLRFLRQFLKSTSVGAVVLEIDKYPVVPGVAHEIFLSQSGRLRLKLLDVLLVCVEEATFNQGTNTLTERRRVYSHRLFRKRGVELSPQEPFETSFPLEIPAGAMHSFTSSCNRITWQIEIHGQTNGFPRVIRSFEIIVTPSGQSAAPAVRSTAVPSA